MANPFAKSRTFHKIGNVAQTPIWKLLPTPAGLALLTTTGRKTGKPRQRAIRAVRSGNSIYAVALLGAHSDWMRNVRANPAVRIKLGGTTYEATARMIDGADDRTEAAAAYHGIAGWYDYFDYMNYVWSVPTRGRLLRVHDSWFESGTPVVFELSQPGRADAFNEPAESRA